MKKIIYISFLSLSGICCSESVSEKKLSEKNGILNFKGVYFTETTYPGSGSGMRYLRFYEDNVVLHASFNGKVNPDELSKLINKNDLKYTATGKYFVQGKNVSFITTSPTAKVAYFGTVNDYGIDFKIYSITTNKFIAMTYGFFPFVYKR